MKIEEKETSESKKGKEKKVPFWSENPNILFDPAYILEFFPVEEMTYEQKLNSVSRTILLLTMIGFLLSQNIRILFIGAVTLFIIFILFFYQEKEKSKKEGYENPVTDYYKENNLSIPPNLFQTPDSSNPFGNVLMTDYDYNPNKRPAPPSFNDNINNKIIEEVKQMVRDVNPGQPDITEKLYKDLGEQMMFEHSLGNYYSNPSTTIPNDQAAFMDFAYGDMISNKEGNPFAAVRQMSRYTNY
jgi:hypothetical protein